MFGLLVFGLFVFLTSCIEDFINPIPEFQYEDFYNAEPILNHEVIYESTDVYDIIVSKEYLGVVIYDGFNASIKVLNDSFNEISRIENIDIKPNELKNSEFRILNDKVYVFINSSDSVELIEFDIYGGNERKLYSKNTIDFSMYSLQYLNQIDDTMYFGLKSSTKTNSATNEAIYELMFIEYKLNSDLVLEMKYDYNSSDFDLDHYSFYFLDEKIYGMYCLKDCDVIQLNENGDFENYYLSTIPVARSSTAYNQEDRIYILRFDSENTNEIYLDIVQNDTYEHILLSGQYQPSNYTNFKCYNDVFLHYKIHGLRMDDTYGNSFASLVLINEQHEISYFKTNEIDTLGKVWIFDGHIMALNIRTNEILIFSLE